MLKWLLSYTDVTIEQIADNLGFNTSNYLIQPLRNTAGYHQVNIGQTKRFCLFYLHENQHPLYYSSKNGLMIK